MSLPRFPIFRGPAWLLSGWSLEWLLCRGEGGASVSDCGRPSILNLGDLDNNHLLFVMSMWGNRAGLSWSWLGFFRQLWPGLVGGWLVQNDLGMTEGLSLVYLSHPSGRLAQVCSRGRGTGARWQHTSSSTSSAWVKVAFISLPKRVTCLGWDSWRVWEVGTKGAWIHGGDSESH